MDNFKIYKRILKEVKCLDKKYSNLKHYKQENDNNIYGNEIYIIEFDYNNKKKMRFKLPTDFPFKQPTFLINNINYKNILCISDEFTRNEIKKYSINNCLCINSVVCNSNWSPALKLTYIIEEYERYKKIMEVIIIKKWLIYFWNKKQIPAIELVDKIIYFI